MKSLGEKCFRVENVAILWYAPALIIYALIFGITYNISKQTFDALKNSLLVEILWKYLTT